MNKFRLFGLFAGVVSILLVLVLAVRRPVKADDGGGYSAFDTGHSVQGDFLVLYQSIPDAEAVIGPPITDVVVRDGRRYQYFLNAVFVAPLSGGSPTLLEVGRIAYHRLYDAREKTPQVLDLGALAGLGCRNFASEVPDKALPVCWEFLKTYETYQQWLGRVVSLPILENSVPVQYFENGRLEIRGGQVVWGELGWWFLEQAEDKNVSKLIAPQDNAAPEGTSAPAHILISTAYGTVCPGAMQTVWIGVYDEFGRPVHNARVTVSFNPGDEISKQTMLTDEHGQVVFQIRAPQTTGHVEIDVCASLAGIEIKEKDSFRVWP